MDNLSFLTPILQQDCLLEASRPVLVGVSGGPDSLCLLDLMHQLGYPLFVAHLNHSLRPEADAESQAVSEAAHARGLPFIMEKADIAVIADSQASSIEETARKVRYRFLFEQARLHHAQAVAVAHTADDQIETVLMHILRGAGLSGLRGMSYRMIPNPWSNDIPLVRPLLGVYREEIITYCSEHNLHPTYDRSNLDTTYFRNRIRQNLIPLLKTYNPGIKSHLWRMAQTLAGDEQVLEALTREAWKDCCIETGMSGVALTVENVLAQPLGIQRRLVRKAISILRPGLRDIDLAAVEKARFFMQGQPQGSRWDLTKGLCLLREGNKVWIVNWESHLPVREFPQLDKEAFQLEIPGRLDLPNGWHFQAEQVQHIHEAIDQARCNTDPFHAWLDLGDSQLPLVIRSLLPGDRFKPLGMDGHSVKLSDFFVNLKLSRRMRRLWPLVCLENEIVWIPGYRLGHSHRLTSSSSRVVFLKLYRDLNQQL